MPSERWGVRNGWRTLVVQAGVEAGTELMAGQSVPPVAPLKPRRFAVWIAALLLLGLIAIMEPWRWSNLRPSFSSLRSNAQRRLSFIVVGDWGSGDSGQRAVASSLDRHFRASARRPDFVLSTGDQIYPSGLSGPTDPLFHDRYTYAFTPLVRSVPWYMSLGNHDCEGDLGAMQQPGGPWASTSWTMPSRFYNITYPSAVLIVLDACNLVCAVGGNPRCAGPLARFDTPKERALRRAQLTWLDQVLSDAPPGAWKIVSAHWALFSQTGNGPTPGLIEHVLPILRRHGVHVWFNGHDHSLQVLQEQGHEWPRFFVSGGGGYGLHPGMKRAAIGAAAKYNPRLAADSSRSFIEHGYMAVDLDEKRMVVTLQRAADNTIIHTTSLTKPPRGVHGAASSAASSGRGGPNGRAAIDGEGLFSGAGVGAVSRDETANG